MLEAIFFGHQAMQPIIDMQVKLKETHGVPKRPFTPPEKDSELVKIVEEKGSSRIYEALTTSGLRFAPPNRIYSKSWEKRTRIGGTK